MSTIESMNSYRESDWIFDADKRARAYDERAVEEKRPLGFNLTTGTPYKDGKEYKPLAITAAEDDRSRDEERSADYLPVAEVNRQMVKESVDRLLYPGKDIRIAADASSSSSGAQIRLWHALRRGYRFTKRMGLDEKSPVITFPPTWPNHIKFPYDHGLNVHVAPYLTEDAEVNIDGIVKQLRSLYGGVVIWPLSPQNPSSKTVDYAMEKIAPICKKQHHTLMLDVSFPGLGEGIEADIQPSVFLAEENITHIVTVSLSKIFGRPGKRAGFLGIVYGKNEGENMAEDTQDLIAAGESTSTFPDSESSDLIRRVIIDENYLQLFLKEQEEFRTSLHRRGGMIREELPEYGKELDGNGPFRYLGTFNEETWNAMEANGVFSAPIEDAWGGIGMRWNLSRIPEERIPEFLEKTGPILHNYHRKKRPS